MQLAVSHIFIQRTLHTNNYDDYDEHKERSNHMGCLFDRSELNFYAQKNTSLKTWRL